MLLLFFIICVDALSDQSVGLCKIAEAMPVLQQNGWKNCSSMTDSYVITTGVSYTGINVLTIVIHGGDVTGYIPTEIGLIKSLTTLYIHDTKLTGTIPKEMFVPNLSYLAINNCSITGILPGSALNTTIIKSTLLTGKLPILRGSVSLINNRFTELSEFSNLSDLDVDYNMITGTIPSFPSSFLLFSARGNRLTGTVPPIHEKFRMLYVKNNLLSGTLQGNFSSLSDLDLSNNSFVGTLNFVTPALVRLMISHNMISGTVPPMGNKFTVFNCSNNRISGTLPIINSIIVDVSNNLLSGTIPRFVPRQITVDVSNNFFSGMFPVFGSVDMNAVIARNNKLFGTIPSNIFSYATILTLDISENNFYGCPPVEPSTKLCNYGGWFYTGCNNTMSICSIKYNDTCLRGSGYYGSKCKPCLCSSGYVCDDGNQGTGNCTVKVYDPCAKSDCEGYCVTGSNGYTCACSSPGYINETDGRSCICPAGYHKLNKTCIACEQVDNCFSRVTCPEGVSICETCKLGYKLVNNSCLLDKDCSFGQWSAWSNCTMCDNGIHSRYRNLSNTNTALPSFCVFQLAETKSCGYPCVNTEIKSQEAIIEYLYLSFTRWNWLNDQLHENMTIIKNSDSLISNNPEFMLESALWILPNVSQSRYTINNNSLIVSGDNSSLTILIDNTSNNKLYALAIIPLLIVILTIYLLLRRNEGWVSQLPPGLRDYYSGYQSWTKENNYYIKQQSVNEEFLDIWRQLDTKNTNIKEVYRVCNPTLGSSFANYREILKQRFEESPMLFMKRDWILQENSIRRFYTIECYEKLKDKYLWNTDNVPILACVHGTDFSIAKSIVSKGFCALASLDAGYYGKGIYFTSSALYARTYYLNKDDPCLIIALGIFGNAYPIIENPNDNNSMLGRPIMSGYQSHYVLTGADGYPCTEMKSEFDELVVSQECQVLPLFIVRVSNEKEIGFRDSITEPLL